MKAHLLSLSLLIAACTGQTPPPGKPAAPAQAPDPAAVLAEVVQQMQKEGITFDPKAQTVAVKAVVNQPQDPIEYLLIHKKGKRHEAIFVTKSKPSVLNAALLMLGLQPGKNATVTEKTPLPTLEEVQAGVDPLIVTPPQGAPFYMTVRWTSPEGKPVEHCVEDMVLDLGTQQALADCSWVYLGGRLARLYKNEPEVYIADFEGNLISVCYLSPDNHLGTMVHKNARDDQNWWTTTLVPPADTEVEFVFHKQETVLHKERSKKLAAAKVAAPKDGDGKQEPPKDGGK
jgi:hypothetical protein